MVPLQRSVRCLALGGGGVLLKGGEPVAYFRTTWCAGVLARFSARLGDARWQSLWEFLTLLLPLMVWGHLSVDETMVLQGDNTAALNDAIAMKGTGSMNHIARELAWRRIAQRWNFEVSHLPSELSTLADDLSRLAASLPHASPAALAG